MSDDDQTKQFELAIFDAMLAERTERYEDMVKYTKYAIGIRKATISDMEKNLISAAYKNLIVAKRQAFRIIDREIAAPETQHLIKEYRLKIENELEKICNDVADLIENEILPRCTGINSEAIESRVFFNKMKADYFRYLAENKEGQECEAAAEKACKAYEMAKEQAESLPGTSSSRIGVLLNYSVFLYEIKKNTKGACEMAESALKLGEDDDDVKSERSAIKRLLHDNLQAWCLQSDQTDKCENESNIMQEELTVADENQMDLDV